MIEQDNSSLAVLMLFAAVVITSGCVQNNSTNLESDFDLEHSDVEINSSGTDIYEA